MEDDFERKTLNSFNFCGNRAEEFYSSVSAFFVYTASTLIVPLFRLTKGKICDIIRKIRRRGSKNYEFLGVFDLVFASRLYFMVGMESLKEIGGGEKTPEKQAYERKRRFHLSA